MNYWPQHTGRWPNFTIKDRAGWQVCIPIILRIVKTARRASPLSAATAAPVSFLRPIRWLLRQPQEKSSAVLAP